MEPQNLKILQNSAISNIKVQQAQPNQQQNQPNQQPLTSHKDSSNQQQYNDKLLSDIPNNHYVQIRTQQKQVNKQYPILKKISSQLKDVQNNANEKLKNNVFIDNKISPDIEDPDESQDSDDRNQEWGNLNYTDNQKDRKEEKMNNMGQFYPNQEKDFGENSSDFDIQGSASQFSRKKQMGQNLNQSSNIYSSTVFYNSEANLNSNQNYPNNQYYDRDQHYHQRQNQFNNFGYKNTDGKQFDDTFKRGFVGNILKMIHGKDESVANSIINKQADRIRVYVNEVKIWISIYKIVFSVENEQSKRRMTEEDTEYLIEQKIIDYLNRHPNEKKYKFNRVANRVFRSLKIKKCTGEYWLQQLLKRFKNKLSPEIGSIKKRLIKNERVRDDDNSDSFPEFQNTNYYDNGRKRLDFMDNNGSRNQGQSRTRIIESIDQEIERAILNIFNSRSRIHGVNVSSLENWYIQYGKYKLFSPDRQKMDQGYTRPRVTPPVENIYSRNNQLYSQPAFNKPNNPQSKMEILQKQVLSFIKKQPSQQVQKYFVYNYGLELAQKKLMIPQLSHQRLFNSWFDRFIQNHCIVQGDYIQIENSYRMQRDGNNFKGNSMVRINANDLGMID